MATQLPEMANQRADQVSLSGFNLINSPRLNKGTAFSEQERDLFDLHGLLPPHVGSKPCRSKASRSSSENAVPLFRRGELIRLNPERET